MKELSTELLKELKDISKLEDNEKKDKLNKFLSKLSPEQIEFLKNKKGSECVFCSIVEGKLKTKKIYEDNKVLAILDINPINFGHTLVIPKKHYSNLDLMKDEEVSYLFGIVNKLKFQISKLIDSEGSNILLSEGVVAGQNVDHIFVNIIPRFSNDGVEFDLKRKKINEEELEKLEKLLSNIRIEKIEEKREINDKSGEINKIYRNLIRRIP